MKFSLIICTYQRPEALSKLLESVENQTDFPDQILIIDGSLDNRTQMLCEDHNYHNLVYCKVQEKDRGLTKQRNYGIKKLRKDSEIVIFLDDDTILDRNFFQEVLKTYMNFPEAVGVSGYILNESSWTKISQNYRHSNKEFCYDGWMRTEGSRFQLRKILGLQPNVPPGMMPEFSHGYSTGFLPPSGKVYEVEFFMGCCMSFRTALFDEMRFSTFFEGYGLYEDMDFCLRVAEKGRLYINTEAKLEHHHDQAGRPNKYKYGKMVLRNGWYVWRIKNKNPSIKAKLKWHSTSFLLTLVRMSNVWNTSSKKEALTESFGRIVGWIGVLFKPPKQMGR